MVTYTLEGGAWITLRVRGCMDRWLKRAGWADAAAVLATDGGLVVQTACLVATTQRDRPLNYLSPVALTPAGQRHGAQAQVVPGNTLRGAGAAAAGGGGGGAGAAREVWPDTAAALTNIEIPTIPVEFHPESNGKQGATRWHSPVAPSGGARRRRHLHACRSAHLRCQFILQTHHITSRGLRTQT